MQPSRGPVGREFKKSSTNYQKKVQKCSKSGPKVIQKWTRRPIDQFPGPGSKKKRFAHGPSPQKERFLMNFEGPKLMKNHVFLEPRFFDKQKHDFLKIVFPLK